jgi:hypothetical protein
MTTTLTRTDTGEMAPVRVIDPGVHVSAPYSRAVGLLDKWAKAERRAVDEFAAWIEGQAAQAHAEMRALCDELGLPVAWAEVPPPSKWPELASSLVIVSHDPTRVPDDLAEVAKRGQPGWTPPRRPHDVMRELYEQRTAAVLAGPAPDENMPGRYRLTPRPQVQAGPRWRWLRWVDDKLERAEAWWERKQAERDKRMGVE